MHRVFDARLPNRPGVLPCLLQGNVLYGLDKELAEKAAAKYDTGLEGECRAWIENVTGDKLGECSLQEELKNGVVLCNLINTIKPGARD